jgi:hypothetical protein
MYKYDFAPNSYATNGHCATATIIVEINGPVVECMHITVNVSDRGNEHKNKAALLAKAKHHAAGFSKS